jgi:iron(III) transport system ATP-binding protein
VPQSVEYRKGDVGTRQPPSVACHAVRKSFGTTVALDRLDLTVAPGRITALLGPSGCGKTTALRLIAGFERPDRGWIELDGRTVATPHELVPPERRRIGMVFQDYALFPHMNVARNVAYGLRDGSRRERRRRAAAAIELVGLAGLEERMPAQLSGGQQQRVALARALAPEPAVVLLDEPFSNLDAALRATVRSDVREILKTSGTTAIFVTHDQEEALSLADEVAVMGAGVVHQVADPHTLYTRPADRFVATFVGDADVLCARRIGPHLVQTPVGDLVTAGEVAEQEVEVVLRPECLQLRAAADGDALVVDVTFYGHDQLIHLRLPDGTAVRSRLGPEPRLRPGDRVRFGVSGPVVVLDARTGRATEALPCDPSAELAGLVSVGVRDSA